MARKILQAVDRVARAQHWVISRRQLLDLGFSSEAIDHAMEKGRLHPVFRGVVGRAELGRLGMWMAAVLACGRSAFLSHESAAALWGIRGHAGDIVVSVSARTVRKHEGIRVHRRAHVDTTTRHGIPVTTPAATLIDLASTHPGSEVEAALNEADLRGLITLEALRDELDRTPPRPGLGKLKLIIDRRTFTFTRSELERRLLPTARRPGLPKPLTRVHGHGYEVDFFFPDLGLVIETDGGSFHRTPAQQTADRRRDQTHTAAGLTVLRFTRGQIRYEPSYVLDVLRTVARRLARA